MAGEAVATKIKHIVFDVGRVLIQWDSEIPFRRLIPDDGQREMFLRDICSPAWNLEQDRGRSFAEAEEVLIAEHPGWAGLIRAFRAHWMEMIPGSIPGSFDILSQLVDDGQDVTLLTNFSQETFPLACKRFPELTRPRGVTVSGEIKLVKPDVEIYNHHRDSFDLDPAATVFFDDSPQNVEGAQVAGWHARLFTSSAQMKTDLTELGVAL
jgi:2-haloacid dehalogenase